MIGMFRPLTFPNTIRTLDELDPFNWEIPNTVLFFLRNIQYYFLTDSNLGCRWVRTGCTQTQTKISFTHWSSYYPCSNKLGIVLWLQTTQWIERLDKSLLYISRNKPTGGQQHTKASIPKSNEQRWSFRCRSIQQRPLDAASAFWKFLGQTAWSAGASAFID